MLTIRPLTNESHEDRANVLRIFLESPSYTELVEGRSPSSEDVEDFFYGKPDSKDAADKFVFGLYVGSEMVGCADVIRAYPSDDCAWIGLLIFSEAQQRRGPHQMSAALENRLVQAVRGNRWNVLILDRAAQLGFEDWWLTAGCIAQSVWNIACGRDIHAGIRDYDLFYYDPDTSWDAENDVICDAKRTFADLPVEVQIRNQARVPLWYENKFGIPFGTVNQASDGIDRFPCATVAVGVKRLQEEFEIYSPFGLTSLFEGVLRPNRALPIPGVYEEKTGRWQREWPHLRRESW